MVLCLKYYTHLCVVLSLKFIDIQSVRPWYLASFLHKTLHRVFSLGSVIYRKKYSAESQKWRIRTIKYFLRKTCAKCNKTWTTLRTLVKYITTHSTLYPTYNDNDNICHHISSVFASANTPLWSDNRGGSIII